MSGRTVSGRGLIWRSILWLERFLPTPKPALQAHEQAAVRRRRAALVPLLVLPAVLMPAFVRSLHGHSAMSRSNVMIAEQIVLGLAIICALAAIVAGVVTWRRERVRQGIGQ